MCEKGQHSVPSRVVKLGNACTPPHKRHRAVTVRPGNSRFPSGSPPPPRPLRTPRTFMPQRWPSGNTTAGFASLMTSPVTAHKTRHRIRLHVGKRPVSDAKSRRQVGHASPSALPPRRHALSSHIAWTDTYINAAREQGHEAVKNAASHTSTAQHAHTADAAQPIQLPMPSVVHCWRLRRLQQMRRPGTCRAAAPSAQRRTMPAQATVRHRVS